MVKAVIFDLDGTLTNRQASGYLFYKKCLKPYFKNMTDIEFEAVLQDMMLYDCSGQSMSHRLLPLTKKYKGYLPENIGDIVEKAYQKEIHKYIVLKKDAKKTLKELKKKYKLAICSNGISKMQRNKIKEMGIEKYFDVVTISGECDYKKPENEIYDLTARKLGVKNSECIFVGDTFSIDIVGASEAGMLPVWIIESEERPCEEYNGIRIKKLKEIENIKELKRNS